MSSDALVVRTKKSNPIVLAALVVFTGGLVGILLLIAWLFDRTPRSVDDVRRSRRPRVLELPRHERRPQDGRPQARISVT